MNLSLFSISGLILSSTCFLLTFIILFFGKSVLHRVWALFNIAVGLWGLGAFLIGEIKDGVLALFVWRFTEISVVFIAVLFSHVTYIICNINRKKFLYFVYIQGIIFSIFSLSSVLFFSGTRFVFNSFYYATPGPLFYLFFPIWSFLIGYSHYYLFLTLWNSKGKFRNQLLYFAVGTMLGFSGGITNFFPHFKLDLYPFGNFTIPLYCIILTYAIVKHHLMDINIVIRKGLVYSILITIFTIIYLSIVIITEKLFQGILGYRSVLFSIISASIIVIIFTPLRNKIQLFIDRIFLGKTLEQIAQENELLRQELMHSEKLKTIATFASGIAHEIKNPLTVIKTFTEYLPQNTGNKEFLQDFSEAIGPEVEKINDLVHQLLDFSKPAPLQLKETDMHKLIDDTIDILSSQLIKHRINVSKDYKFSINGSAVKVDPQKMKQVFMNIFINAIEAMPKGGELFIETNQQNNELHISVQDTGYGIPEKDMPHIFEPFYSTKEKGSGLGLSIIYTIIKEHRGKIKVESKIGEGARFIVELPIYK